MHVLSLCQALFVPNAVTCRLHTWMTVCQIAFGVGAMYRGFVSDLRIWHSYNSRNGLDRGASVPGAFKLDHLDPVKPILFSKFYNFFTFIMEANSYYPRELIMRKGNSSNSRNGLDRGASVPGAFKLDHLHPVKPILFSKFSNFFTFILGANSYYPRERKAENGEKELTRNG